MTHRRAVGDGAAVARNRRRAASDDLDVVELIDGFPVDAPWLASGALWFDDLPARERTTVRRLFEDASVTSRWPAAPDVGRADDPSLVAWVAATLHVVTRLRQETVAFAELLIRADTRASRTGFVLIPSALGPSLELLERARDHIDAEPRWIRMAVALNALTLALVDSGAFPAPPASLARFVDLHGGHWADATYRHHQGREFYRRLDRELSETRARVLFDDATPWDLHAWVFALVTLWTGTPVRVPSP